MNLKYRRYISEPKRYNQIFEIIITSLENSFLFITFFNLDFIYAAE